MRAQFVRAGLVLALLCRPALAQDAAICAALEPLMVTGHSKPQLNLPPPFPGAGKCAAGLAQSGTQFTHCAWAFDYRAPQANDAFEQMAQAVSNCLDGRAAAEQDLRVNHPDSYDLREFVTPMGRILVSLKDKGALGETYVFVRMIPAK